MSAFLEKPRYRAYLSDTHPHLQMCETRLEVSSYVATLETTEPLKPGVLRTALELVGRVWRTPTAPSALFLGTPFERYEQSWLLDDVHDVPRLAARAVHAAKAARAELVVLTNVDPAHPQCGAWRAAGFAALPSFPDAVLDLTGKTSLEAHLACLPAGDRSSVRRNTKKFARAGHRLERLSASTAEAEALFAAYTPFRERAMVRWHAHTVHYFAELAALDPRVHLTAAKDAEGAIIGFAVNFADGDVWHAGRVGVAPAYHKRDAVYFRLMYHLIEEAIAGGARALTLEPTAYRFKRHLGAVRKPLVNLVRGVSLPWRAALALGQPIGRHALRHLSSDAALEALY